MALEFEQRRKQSKKLKKFNSSETSEDHQLILTLPPEIIVEILKRCSVEELLRCKSACKSWCSLISDPHFIKSHLSFSASNSRYPHHRLIFTTVRRARLQSCSLSDLLQGKYNAFDHVNPLIQRYYDPLVSIVGSCNGLLCICLWDDTLYIWNPGTRIWNRLCVGFRNCRWRVFYGFGYDESTKDYKVVGISRFEGHRVKDENKVKIYSLKTRSWKKIGDFPHSYPLNDSGKFSNGALHWGASELFDSDPWTIVAIDLADETYHEILQPVYDKGNKHLTLGVLDGHLCVLCNYGANHADVWVIKVHGGKDSWSKLVSIPYLTDPGRDRFSMPFFISNVGKVLLRLGSRLVVYDSKNCSFSKIQNFDDCFNAITFVESLVSPCFPIKWNFRKRRIS